MIIVPAVIVLVSASVTLAELRAPVATVPATAVPTMLLTTLAVLVAPAVPKTRSLPAGAPPVQLPRSDQSRSPAVPVQVTVAANTLPPAAPSDAAQAAASNFHRRADRPHPGCRG